MKVDGMDPALTFCISIVTLYAAHQVGDHWVQTQKQACTKGNPGWRGHAACARHCATYTLTGVAALVAVAVVLHVHFDPARVAAGLAVSAVSHYIADRRTPLRWLAQVTGHGEFFALGAPRAGHDDNPSLGTGAYAMDQSWHIAWLFIAALVIAGT